MPKNADFGESRLHEACKAVLAQNRPKIAQIAREFGVSRTTLSTRVKKARSHFTTPESAKNALTAYQEKALTS
jgi:transposase-like protein